MHFRLFAVLSIAFSASVATRAYSWPNHGIDTLETILYQQEGFNSNPILIDLVHPCSSDFGFSTGRTTSAEWFRTAYHDMATADIFAGTGGLDASIGFESDRPENVGKFINASLLAFLPTQNPVAGMADLIALATTQAVGICSNGSVIIPYSAGRVDATEAGPFGVPQPQEPLETHIAEFARQGFTTDEMIGLVACGHTLGGVHGVDFPTIVPILNDPSNADSRVNFDDSVANFDNNVAVQFVDNVTQNPLAFGPNVTTRSDHRIFTSDGGKIINKMATSTEYFFETCASLLERMLNTVPRGVKLTPVPPISVKPQSLAIGVNGDGTLSFNGTVRLLEGVVASASDLPTVNIHYTPRSGLTCTNCTIPTNTSDAMLSNAFYNNMPTFRSYEWSAKIPVSAGISGILVEVIHKNGSAKTYGNEDEDGVSPFPVQDLIIVDFEHSCQSLQTIIVNNTPVATTTTFNMTALVLDSAELSDITLTLPNAITQQGSVTFRFQDENVPMTRGVAVQTGDPDVAYRSYTASLQDTTESDNFPDFTVGITGMAESQKGREVVGYPYILSDIITLCSLAIVQPGR